MGIFDEIKNRLEDRKQKEEQQRLAIEEEKKKELIQLKKFANGENLPELNMGENTALIMHKNEICHFCWTAERANIKAEPVGYEGGYGGISFRVAKGVTLHSGGTRGHAIKKEITRWYKGTLFITNKRIVFIPLEQGIKSFTIPLNKLLSCQGFTDGVILQKEDNSYTLSMEKPDLFRAILTGVIKKYVI